MTGIKVATMDVKVATTGPILGNDVCQIGRRRVAHRHKWLQSSDHASRADVVGFHSCDDGYQAGVYELRVGRRRGQGCAQLGQFQSI